MNERTPCASRGDSILRSSIDDAASTIRPNDAFYIAFPRAVASLRFERGWTARRSIAKGRLPLPPPHGSSDDFPRRLRTADLSIVKKCSRRARAKRRERGKKVRGECEGEGVSCRLDECRCRELAVFSSGRIPLIPDSSSLVFLSR